ncbi:MAG: hypothetical protein KGI28_01440 [Thaumarchaeota archaeon]|nr:hypothetical protein [Nitrososphaerota archaeon]
MSKEDITVDWDKLWDEYNQVVKAWWSVFETFQNATTYAQTMYNDLIAKASKESNIYPMNQFIENWQNVFNKPTMEQLKHYGDMIKKFSEDHSWYEMWNKNMMTNTKKGKTIPVLKSKKVRKSPARKSKKSRVTQASKSKKDRKNPARRFKKISR